MKKGDSFLDHSVYFCSVLCISFKMWPFGGKSQINFSYPNVLNA